MHAKKKKPAPVPLPSNVYSFYQVPGYISNTSTPAFGANSSNSSNPISYSYIPYYGAYEVPSSLYNIQTPLQASFQVPQAPPASPAPPPSPKPQPPIQSQVQYRPKLKPPLPQAPSLSSSLQESMEEAKYKQIICKHLQAAFTDYYKTVANTVKVAPDTTCEYKILPYHAKFIHSHDYKSLLHAALGAARPYLDFEKFLYRESYLPDGSIQKSIYIKAYDLLVFRETAPSPRVRTKPPEPKPREPKPQPTPVRHEQPVDESPPVLVTLPSPVLPECNIKEAPVAAELPREPTSTASTDENNGTLPNPGPSSSPADGLINAFVTELIDTVQQHMAQAPPQVPPLPLPPPQTLPPPLQSLPPLPPPPPTPSVEDVPTPPPPPSPSEEKKEEEPLQWQTQSKTKEEIQELYEKIGQHNQDNANNTESEGEEEEETTSAEELNMRMKRERKESTANGRIGELNTFIAHCIFAADPSSRMADSVISIGMIYNIYRLWFYENIENKRGALLKRPGFDDIEVFKAEFVWAIKKRSDIYPYAGEFSHRDSPKIRGGWMIGLSIKINSLGVDYPIKRFTSHYVPNECLGALSTHVQLLKNKRRKLRA